MLRHALPVAVLVLAAACTREAPTAQAPDHAHAGIAASRGGPLGPQVMQQLARVRAATAAYHDIDKAIADGYTVWSPSPFVAGATCPSLAGVGQMGYHLVKVPLRGPASDPRNADATIDPMQPEMLIYERRADGRMHLVGVEYIVFTAAWERVNGRGAPAPTVFGQPLLASAHPFPGGVGDIPHYELHVWLWTSNPLGMFAPWNPTVTC
jgi:hypothetical protein